MLQVHLFGPPRLSNGSAAAAGGLHPTSWRLLAYLMLRTGPHSRQSVAFSLWPDDPEATALAKLRRNLYKTLRALPSPSREPWCIARDSTIEWNAASDFWLDTKEFERLKASHQMLASAVELYAADLLEGYDDEWILSERDRLRSGAISALTQLVAEHWKRRDFGATLDYSRRLLALEPWREDIVRLVLMSRYEMGDRAGALHEFEQFQARLRAEMSTDVMTETAALRDRIVHNATVAHAAIDSTAALPAGTRQRSLLPFTGRDSEIEQLMLHWNRAERGLGSVMFLAGEAGVGKSRLAQELAALTAARGARVLIGAATQLEQLPYGAFADALRPHVGQIADSDIGEVWLAALAWLLPDIAVARPGLPKLEPLREGREHFRTFEAIARAFEILASSSPIFFILEDAQWAGSSTLAALEFLARRLQSVPLMLLVTYRNEELFQAQELRSMRRRLLREQKATVMQLDRLSRRSVDRLMTTALRIPSRPELFGFVYSVSDGNALIVSQLVHAFIEAGAPETSQFVQQSVHTLSGILAERFERLPNDSLRLVEIAAVVGTVFDAELLARITGWNERRVQDALNDLLDREIIREGAEHNRYEYAFSHHLIQSTVSARIPPSELKTKHQRIAHVLERLLDYPDGQAAGLAAHWEMSGDDARAATWYLRAARSSASCFAHAEAVRFSSKALSLTRDSRLRAEAMLVRESANGQIGDRGAQEGDIDALERLARSQGDAELACEALQRGIALRRLLGDRERQRALIARLRRRAARAKSALWLARAEQELADWEMVVGQNAAAIRRLERVARTWRELGDIDALTQCLYLQGELAMRLEDYKGLLRFADDLDRIDREHPNPMRRARICDFGALVAFRQQDMERALSLSRSALDALVAGGDRRGEAIARRQLGVVLGELGSFTEAEAQLETSEQLLRTIADPEIVASVLHARAHVMARLGKWAQARDQEELAMRMVGPLRSPQRDAICHMNLSYYYARLGDVPAALAAGNRFLKLASPLKIPFLMMFAHYNLAAIQVERKDLQASLRHVEHAIRIARQIGKRDVFCKALAVRSALRVQLGDEAGARRDISTAVDALDVSQFDDVDSHTALWLVALVLRSLGDRNQASNFAGRAYELVRKRMSAIHDDDARESFAGISFNREIVAAVETDTWPSLEQTQAY
jgi:predicted ATPase/DNA-binding SARP family transcriptional activator